MEINSHYHLPMSLDYVHLYSAIVHYDSHSLIRNIPDVDSASVKPVLDSDFHCIAVRRTFENFGHQRPKRF